MFPGFSWALFGPEPQQRQEDWSGSKRTPSNLAADTVRLARRFDAAVRREPALLMGIPPSEAANFEIEIIRGSRDPSWLSPMSVLQAQDRAILNHRQGAFASSQLER